MSVNEIIEILKDYLKRPCAFCLIEEEEENPNTFEIIYRNRILGYVGYVPTIGDSIFGYTVWEVDYEHRYAYVDK